MLSHIMEYLVATERITHILARKEKSASKIRKTTTFTLVFPRPVLPARVKMAARALQLVILSPVPAPMGIWMPHVTA